MNFYQVRFTVIAKLTSLQTTTSRISVELHLGEREERREGKTLWKGPKRVRMIARNDPPLLHDRYRSLTTSRLIKCLVGNAWKPSYTVIAIRPRRRICRDKIFVGFSAAGIVRNVSYLALDQRATDISASVRDTRDLKETGKSLSLSLSPSTASSLYFLRRGTETRDLSPAVSLRRGFLLITLI